MDHLDHSNCLFCEEYATREKGNGDYHIYNCDRCGKYKASGSLVAILEHNNNLAIKEKLFLVSAKNRELQKNQQQTPEYFNPTKFTNFVNRIVEPSVQEKQELLLKNLSSLVIHPGAKVNIQGSIDYPLSYARNQSEFSFYLSSLRDRDLIKYTDGSGEILITSIGWDYLDKLRLNPKKTQQAFVAMSFNNELEELWYNAIYPAIDEAGYKPVRVDKDEHNEKICDRIISEIRKSLFIVADFTEQKHGVYFEAGFAMGLGIPVIWTVYDKDVDDLHFDTRQYNHIIWHDHADLKENLKNRINATI